MPSQPHSTSLPEPSESSVDPLAEPLFEPELEGAKAAASSESPESDEERDETVSDLSGRATRGASWTLIGTLFTQVLGLARTAALARLLSQNDFGLVAMALTVIGALYTLTNSGVGGSIISMPMKTRRELHDYTNAVWTMEVARGVIVALLLALMAWPVSLFYRDDRLTPILVALALTPILTSATNVGLALQTRRMEFTKSTLHSMVNGLLTVVLTVAVAWWTRNYWALVWGQVIGAFMGMALSYGFSSYRPRLNFDVAHMKRAFSFGKHIFVIGMATFVLTVMDNVIVGRVMGATALGVYAVAYAFCNLPRAFINSVFNTILFPMFSSVNREGEARVNAILERALTMACVVLLATITPLVAFTPAVIRVMFGTEWAAAVGPMRILLLAGIFVSLLILLSTFLIGINQPGVESRAKILDAVVFLIVIYPFTLWQGVIGAALGSCLTSLVSLLYRWRVIRPVAPLACRRLPWLIGSALLCFGVISGASILASSLIASGFDPSAVHPVRTLLSQPLPSLGVAWLQLVLGLPLLGALSLGCFVLVQPMARGEVATLWSRARGRLGGRLQG